VSTTGTKDADKSKAIAPSAARLVLAAIVPLLGLSLVLQMSGQSRGWTLLLLGGWSTATVVGFASIIMSVRSYSYANPLVPLLSTLGFFISQFVFAITVLPRFTH
jgi:hypothetical protein